jgi:hypothetical protein
VEDELFECVASLGHDQQPERGPAGGEDLFDRAATSDELLVGPEQVWCRERVPGPGPGRGSRARRLPRSTSGRTARANWAPGRSVG